jgi:integrase
MASAQRIRGSNRLTALKVAKASGRALLTDGNGLQLIVEANGSKRWSCRVTIGGKRINRGLGPYPDISLDDARRQAEDLRRAARNGSDLARAIRQEHSRAQVTFRDAFGRYFEEVKRPTLKPGRFADRWPESMEQYVYPAIGGRPVADITAAEIIALLQPIWHTKRETATRVLQRVALAFRSAIVRGDRVLANPCDGVREELGKARPAVTHRRALPWQGVPAFVRSLEDKQRISEASRLALLFLIHTGCRSEEVRGASWSEVAFETCEWTVPADRMKMRREHIVPLSTGAVAIIERARSLQMPGCDLIFPSRAAKMLSDNTLSKLMRDAAVDGTPHGFRTSFKVWASENGVRDEVSEAVLAHGDPNKVRAAYRRTTFIDERRITMQAWSDYLNSIKAIEALRA